MTYRGQHVKRVHMTGSEWFSTSAGGLNRYFESLHAALAEETSVEVTAAALGRSPSTSGAQSWGSTDRSTIVRTAASLHGPRLKSGDVLDRHFALYGQSARGRLGRASLVVHFHGPWAAEGVAAGSGRGAEHLKAVLERARYQRADLAIVLSHHFKDLLVNDYGLDDALVEVVPPGVDLNRFTADRFAPSTQEGQVVLCVRRLERRMGIHVLLESWRQVLREHPNATLVIVGTGTYERDLRALAERLCPPCTVIFTGALSDNEVVQQYRRSSLTVVPSIALEGFGLIALESLAVGRAPIVTDCGGLPDAVRTLDASLVVPRDDADALAERLASALSGYRPSAEHCRHHAESFTWSAAAARHVELYARL